MRARRILLTVFVVSLVLTAALGVAALLVPAIPFEDELLQTSALLTAYSLAGLICAFLLGGRRRRLIVVAAAACLAVTFVGWLALIWLRFSWRGQTVDLVARWSGVFTIFSAAGLHAGLLLLLHLRRTRSRLALTVTLACGALLSLWGIGMCLTDGEWDDEFIVRLAGAAAIITSIGTIAAPVLARLDKLELIAGGDTILVGAVPVSIRCPRCGAEQQIPANRNGRCDACGLRIRIEFEEPRCACGYLLVGLTGNTCPECGKTFADDAKWSAHAEP